MIIAGVDINPVDEVCLVDLYAQHDQLCNAGPVLGLARQ